MARSTFSNIERSTTQPGGTVGLGPVFVVEASGAKVVNSDSGSQPELDAGRLLRVSIDFQGPGQVVLQNAITGAAVVTGRGGATINLPSGSYQFAVTSFAGPVAADGSHPYPKNVIGSVTVLS